MGKRLFRHRRMFAPLWVLAVLALLPWIGEALGLSPLLALPAGAVLTAAAVLRAGRGRRRRTALIGVGGTLWALLALLLGATPLVLGLLVVVWLPPAALWWRGARIRSRIVVREHPVRLLPGGRWWWQLLRRRDLGRAWAELRRAWGPSNARRWWAELARRRAARRTLTAICNDWRRTAAAAEVPGCRIRLAEADEVAYTLHIDLRRGQPHERMVRHHSMLGSALGADLGTLRIEPQRRMDRVRIRWVHQDPLAGEAIPWPYTERPEVTSALQPFTLGPNELGAPVQVRLADGLHTLVVGVTDAGKSTTLNVLVASAAGMADVVLWGIDAAGGVEFKPWGPVWERLATDELSGVRLVAALDRVVQARLGVLVGAGRRKWEPRLGPFVVVVVDELAQLSPGLRRRLGKLVQLCRKCGVRLVVATNHPSVEETNSSLRSQLDRVICLRLKSPDAIRMAFDMDKPQAAGWDPTALTAPGAFLIRSPRHQEPLVARAYLLDDEMVAAVAERLAWRRPRLDPESAAAAEAGEGDGLADVDQAPATLAAAQGDLGDSPGISAAEHEQRLQVLLRALRAAPGPISARAASRLTRLPREWVSKRGLPDLERRGKAEQTAGREWRAAEAAGGGEA